MEVNGGKKHKNVEKKNRVEHLHWMCAAASSCVKVKRRCGVTKHRIVIPWADAWTGALMTMWEQTRPSAAANQHSSHSYPSLSWRSTRSSHHPRIATAWVSASVTPWDTWQHLCFERSSATPRVELRRCPDGSMSSLCTKKGEPLESHCLAQLPEIAILAHQSCGKSRT